MVEALTQSARDKARFRGVLTAAMSIAALRSTVEMELISDGRALPGVKGVAQFGGKTLAPEVGLPHIRLDKAVEFLIGDLL